GHPDCGDRKLERHAYALAAVYPQRTTLPEPWTHRTRPQLLFHGSVSSVRDNSFEAQLAREQALVRLVDPFLREDLDHRRDVAAGNDVERLGEELRPVVRRTDDLEAVARQRERRQGEGVCPRKP